MAAPSAAKFKCLFQTPMTSSIMNRYYKGSAIEYDEQNAVKNGKTKIRNLFYCQNNSHYKQTVLYYILLIGHIESNPGPNHRRLYRVKNMLAMYLKYHKAGLTPTTPVTSIAISPVKMSIGRKSLTNLRSEMIFLQGKPVF